jgi:hypothetical protein
VLVAVIGNADGSRLNVMRERDAYLTVVAFTIKQTKEMNHANDQYS